MQGINNFNTSKKIQNMSMDSVHSVTIGKKIRNLGRIIGDVEVSGRDKVRIGNFLCHKLYRMVVLPEQVSSAVVQALSNVLVYDDTCGFPVRLYYTRFADEKIGLDISEMAYRNNLSTAIPETPYFEVLKYMLKNPFLPRPLKDSVIDEFELIFTLPITGNYTRMQIADIFILNGMATRGEEMLAWIRNDERRDHDGDASVNGQKTVYQDSQNVHDHSVNQSVLRACANLILDMEKKPNYHNEVKDDEILKVLLKINPRYQPVYNKILERINIDTARYTYEGCEFNLYQLFSSLWYYISHHSHSKELYQRLVEEIIAAHNYCSTGHLSRFINVLQGFLNEGDEKRYTVHISDEAQILAVVRAKLDRDMKKASADVIEAMIEEDQTKFLMYVQKCINDEMKMFEKEYRDSIQHIPTAVHSYTRVDGWVMKDSLLTWAADQPTDKK